MHVKRGNKSCKPTPIFSDTKISSDLHRFHGVSDRRLRGGGKVAPFAPPPRVATPLSEVVCSTYLHFERFDIGSTFVTGNGVNNGIYDLSLCF